MTKHFLTIVALLFFGFSIVLLTNGCVAVNVKPIEEPAITDTDPETFLVYFGPLNTIVQSHPIPDSGIGIYASYDTYADALEFCNSKPISNPCIILKIDICELKVEFDKNGNPVRYGTANPEIVF